MVVLKEAHEIELIRENCLIVSKALALVGELIRPGITGKELDRRAEELIRDLGSTPGFKDYDGFPATLCISVNEGVVHGIPKDEEFQEGDIVSVDCGSYSKSYYGDAAYTFALGSISEDEERLLRVTKESLALGIAEARVGKRIGDIGYAVQQLTEKEHGFGVVRELVGHGVGKDLHEDPQVPNYGRRGRGLKLVEGMVIAIEPMITLGKRRIVQADDGWTIITKDRKAAAHYEHTVAVGKNEADILSDHSGVELSVKNNPYVIDI